MLTLDPKVASPLPQTSELKLHLNLRNRLEDPPYETRLPKTGLDAASFGPPGYVALRKKLASLRKKLASLPSSVAATAIVELRRGLDPASAYELLARNQITYPDSSTVAVYLQPMNVQITGGMTGNSPDERVSWPNPAVAGFQAWVKALRKSDNQVLDGLGLPRVNVLRGIAEQPEIYGLVLDQASPQQLLRFLADPWVTTIRVGDIAYNFSRRSA